MDIEAIILENAKTARSVSDVAYLSDLLPEELDELLEARPFRIQFEKVRIEYREGLFKKIVESGNGTQLLELCLRSLTNEGKKQLRHPREVKEDDSGIPDEIIIKLGHG